MQKLLKIVRGLSLTIIILSLLNYSFQIFDILTGKVSEILKNISPLISLFGSQIYSVYEMVLKSITNLEAFYNIISIVLVSFILIVVLIFSSITISKINIIINKGIENLDRIGFVLIMNLVLIFGLIGYYDKFLLSTILIVKIIGFLILILSIAIVVLLSITIYNWIVENKGKALFDYQNKFIKLSKFIFITLVIYCGIKISMMYVMSFVVENSIRDINIPTTIFNDTLTNLDLNTSVVNFLPEFVVNFFNGIGIKLDFSLSSLGLNFDVLSTLLGTTVVTPVNQYLHQIITNFLNGYIFNNIEYFVMILSTSIISLITLKNSKINHEYKNYFIIGSSVLLLIFMFIVKQTILTTMFSLLLIIVILIGAMIYSSKIIKIYLEKK